MKSSEIICDILDFLDNNINQKIDIEELANRFYLNKYYLMKLFKKEIGLTINNYINSLRIYNSLKDLKENNSILKVALQNGFYSQEYFSEMFKKILGVNPITYKKFLTLNKNITDKEIDNILNNIIALKDITNKKEEYLKKFQTKKFNSVLTLYTKTSNKIKQ